MAKLIINKRLVSVQCGSSGVDLHLALSLSLTHSQACPSHILSALQQRTAGSDLRLSSNWRVPRTEYILDGSGEPNIELCCDNVRVRAQ